MRSPRINVVGKILEGDDVGSLVKILNDADNTGGYLILVSTEEEFVDGYDDWVENYKALKGYFEEANWVVDWEYQQVD